MKKFDMKGLDLKQIAGKLVVIYVILQPIFDLYMSLFDEVVQIAGISLATVMRFFLVFVMTILVVISERKNKITWGLGAYAAAVVVYVVLHHINAVGFTVVLPHAEYNMVDELVYLARMCIPPAMIYVIYMVKPKYKDIKLAIVSVSVIISSVIIISNILGIGYVAYDLEKTPISDNMISWFTGTDSHWTTLTCRGLFQWTNQVSGVMLITLPFLIYVCLKEKKAYYWLFAVMHIIAMINLGTRIAAIGGVLVLLAVAVLHFIEKIIHKGSFKSDIKNYVFLALSLVVIAAIFVNSPMIIRSAESNLFGDIITNNPGSSTEIPETQLPEANGGEIDIEPLTDKEKKLAYIESYLATGKINGIYVYEEYPYTEDYEFWYNLIKDVPEWKRLGNRNMRGYMIGRILERDGRFSNSLLGISYTRSSSFVWPERDIETHYDSLGIIGMILFIGPYIIALLVGIWMFFKRFVKNTRLSYCIYLISLGLGILNAYYSGHIMNEIFPFVFLSLMAGMTLNTAQSINQEEE